MYSLNNDDYKKNALILNNNAYMAVNNEKNCYDTIIEYIKYFGYLIYHKKIEEQLYCDTCLHLLTFQTLIIIKN